MGTVKTEVSRLNASMRLSGLTPSSTHVRLLAKVANSFVAEQIERAVVLTRMLCGRSDWTGRQEEQW